MKNHHYRRAPSGRTLALAGFAAGMLLTPEHAFAYVGPGAGLTAIGTVLALVGALLLAIIGVAWYPIKRLLRRPSRKRPPLDDGGSAA